MKPPCYPSLANQHSPAMWLWLWPFNELRQRQPAGALGAATLELEVDRTMS